MLAILLTLFPLSALAVPTEVPDAEIARIEVKGVVRVESAVVRGAMDLHPGEFLTAEAARKTLSDVHQTGLFDDVRLDWTPIGSRGRVVLVVTVDEKPAVRDVHIVGASKLESSDLRELIPLKSWTVLDAEQIAAGEQAVRDKYTEEGFYLATVDTEVVEVDGDVVDVRFVVDERRKVRVEQIVFEGVQALPEARLRRFMSTKEGGVLPWITGRGTYDPEEVDVDRQRIGQLYWEVGHLDVDVPAPDVFLSTDESALFLTFHIDEGRSYTIGEVEIEGDLAPEEGLSEATLRDLIDGRSVVAVEESQWREAAGRGAQSTLDDRSGHSVRVGDTFALSAVQAVALKVQALYGDRGYAMVRVNPQPYPQADGTVRLVYGIDMGDKARLRMVHIKGNDPTLDRVVRRELGVHEGELWHASRVEAARQALLRNDWFSEVVFEVVPVEDGWVDLRIEIEEKPVQQASVGVSADPRGGLGGMGSYQSANILGTGMRGGAQIRYAPADKSLSLNLHEPALFDSPWDGTIGLHAMKQNAGLDEWRRGASLSLGRALDPKRDVRLSARYSIDHREVLGLDPYQERLLGGDLFRTGLTSKATIGLSIDKRNRRLHPTKGWYFSADTSLAGGLRVNDSSVLSALGGDFNFAEASASLRLYQPIDPEHRFVLRFNSQVSTIHSLDGRAVPWVHRYRVGGVNSVRGYAPFSVGTAMSTLDGEDPSAAEGRLIVGGTSMWVNNLELEWNVLPAAGLSAVGFIDAGNAFGDPWGKGGLSPSQLQMSVGVGVHWNNSPMGPIRVEVGVPLNSEDGKLRPVPQIGFGVMF